MTTVSAVVLAAGLSSRMGGPHKLLLDVGGEPMLRRVVRSVLAVDPAEVIVVTGYRAEDIKAALDGLPVRFVHNPAFAEGQPHRRLFHSAVGANQHQIGHVAARNQKHKSNRAQQHQQRRTNIGNYFFLQRDHLGGHALVCLWILGCQPAADYIDIGLGLLERHSIA